MNVNNLQSKNVNVKVHPGQILLDTYIPQTGLLIYQFAKAIGVDRTTISQIINHKRSITPDVACRLSIALGTTPEFWLILQSKYDLCISNEKKGHEYQRIKKLV